MTRLSTWLAWAVWCTWLATTTLAWGEPDPQTARAVAEGKAALKQRRHDAALAHFRRGLETARDAEMRWQIHLGMAIAHELAGEPVRAALRYRTFVTESAEHPAAESGRWPERRASAIADLERVEEELLKTHALVTLITTPPGARVDVSEPAVAPLTSTPAAMYLPAGQHTVRARRDGFLELAMVVSVDAGQRAELERGLVEAPPSAAPSPPPAPAPPATRPPLPPEPPPFEPIAPPPAPTPSPRGILPSSALPPLGWTMVGVGTASLVAGVSLSVVAADTGNEIVELGAGPIDDEALARDAELRARLRRLESGAAALYAGGGVLVAAGVVLLLLAPDDEAATGGLRPLVMGPSGLGIGGRF